eukprot:TRINITY_DN1521_c0_g1_i2.p1 TRINITY_DN1521_c0_g1~~TRINITY_DN1521_c0_g1_i2.p1  ORF type:complete len:1212 (+),score=159.84 TRINITY_DN1521_c0_g1_i2:186-3821(+)
MESTQISIGGFREGVTAEQLAEYLEQNVGTVARCRLKTSVTPPRSYPKFQYSRNDIFPFQPSVTPHAFVQFLSTLAVKSALKLAKRGELVFNGDLLKIREGNEPFLQFQRRRSTNPFRFSKARIQVGSLVEKNVFLVAWTCSEDVGSFHVDPFDNRCRIFLIRDQLFSTEDKRVDTLIKCDFKVEVGLRDIASVRVLNDRGIIIILIRVSNPPSIYYRTADDDIYVSVPFPLLDDEDPWIRTLDFTENNAFGRCLVYRISVSPRFGHTIEDAKRYFRRHRLLEEEENSDSFLRVRDEPYVPSFKYFFSIPHKPIVRIPEKPKIKKARFEISFLLNGLVHKGILNYHKLNDEFFFLLHCNKSHQNKSDLDLELELEIRSMALKVMHNYTTPVYDALKELKDLLHRIRNHRKPIKSPSIRNELMEVKRLFITPTKAYCLPPEVELSNRVLRYYHSVAEFFLRVTFMDENWDPLNSGALNVTIAPIAKDVAPGCPSDKTAIFKRIRQILFDGFDLCGRRYSFLAFSANQLRDRSAWFFADAKGVSADEIRRWMGKFSDRNVAKHAARMGQCFSSTYHTVDVPKSQVEELQEIVRNGYMFSDGIGKITPALALDVTQRLQLSVDPPSAFQIRYAGYKGVVSTWPAKPGSRFQLSLRRRSMKKFDSAHRVLEIITWTRFLPGFLNRQIITLLSALGVPNKAFSDLQTAMVQRIGHMVDNAELAFEILTTSCAGMLPNTAAIMLSAGFNPTDDPHLKDMLSAIRAAQLDDLLRKSRIFVHDSRWLMGCLDELGVLEYGQCFIRVSTSLLKNRFVKNAANLSQSNGLPVVITGKVVVAKNPCLHPGDIRILEAVDAPELHHLIDCLVFPQKGDRPHPNEASGSDLDGDVYFVSWDSTIMPPMDKSCEPMDYTPSKANELDHDVELRDIIHFFTKHMVSDTLGRICNAHVVRADLSEKGAFDEGCLELAKLAAIAVDFPKTGVGAEMPAHLRPKQYPDFLAKPEYCSYESQKILGVLYRQIKNMFGEEIENWKTCVDSENTFRRPKFDADLVVDGYLDHIEVVWNHKCEYDQQLHALLSAFNVKREGELASGHVSSLLKLNKKREGDIKDKLQHAYRALRKEYRKIFEDGQESGTFTPEQHTKYDAKASAWYYVTYHPTWVERGVQQLKDACHSNNRPLLSFPWICTDHLAKIKLQKLYPDVDHTPLLLSFRRSMLLKE